MAKPHIILGPPGTGKTTRLLSIVMDEIRQNRNPEKIGFVSFTKKAVEEAKQRAELEYGYSNKSLPWFRTLHSIAYKGLKLKFGDTITRTHYRELSDMIGTKIYVNPRVKEETIYGLPKGVQMLYMDTFARSAKRSLEDSWAYIQPDVSLAECTRFTSAYSKFRNIRAVYDFTDMLEQFVVKGNAPDLDLLVIDEAQDLSELQWDVVDRLCEKAKRMVIAGDDDQAIFRWAGASVEHFINLDGTSEVLNQSWRLPKEVHRYAGTIVNKMNHRRSKEFSAVEREGSVRRVRTLMQCDFSKGEWMILCRHRHYVDNIAEDIERMGYAYTTNTSDVRDRHTLKAAVAWEKLRKGEFIECKDVRMIAEYINPAELKFIDKSKTLDDLDSYSVDDFKISKKRLSQTWYAALNRIPARDREYFRAARSKGERLLSGEPRIHITTIHSVKGGEAPNVAVIPDITERVSEAMRRSPAARDDELRVFYVAVTRAKEQLCIVEPQTGNFLDI